MSGSAVILFSVHIILIVLQRDLLAFVRICWL
uniref:Uncharacterized protein n=1 Tax=Arundo donax TaxID=35708 RepID=A0A0A9HSS1_ARUDO